MKQTFIVLGFAALLLLAACAGTACRRGNEKTASLSFDSFDGGGPSYSIVIEDPSTVSVEENIRYHSPNHGKQRGSGYTVTYVFTGLKPGETYANVSARSAIAENYDKRYAIKVDEDLNVGVQLLTAEDLNDTEARRPRADLVLTVNDKTFRPSLADNSSSEAFLDKLKEEGGSLELNLHDYGGFEKVGPLPWDLPRNDERITTVPGDIILYQGNQLTIYYDENTWEFTRLGKIDSVSKEDLLEALGDGDVTVTFWLEWDE